MVNYITSCSCCFKQMYVDEVFSPSLHIAIELLIHHSWHLVQFTQVVDFLASYSNFNTIYFSILLVARYFGTKLCINWRFYLNKTMELTFKGTRNLDFQLRHAKASLNYMRNRFARILKKQK